MPSASMTPQPVFRRPGSMPMMRTLGIQLGHHLIGNIRIAEDILHVVIFIQRIDKLQKRFGEPALVLRTSTVLLAIAAGGGLAATAAVAGFLLLLATTWVNPLAE